jgi:hypothetical protein
MIIPFSRRTSASQGQHAGSTDVRTEFDDEAPVGLVGRWTGSTSVLVIFVSLTVVLLASVLIGLFLVEFPPLAWLGLAAASFVIFGLATLATAVSPRLRFNPQRPAMPVDGAERLLVVADEHCGSPALWQEIHARLADAVAVHLVVPVRVSHLHYLTNDERAEASAAEARVALAIGLLRRRGVAVTGGVGSDDPLESMTDALAAFPATRVLMATSTEEDSYWLERGLLAKARALTPLPITHVVVPPTPRSARVSMQRAAAKASAERDASSTPGGTR